METRSSPTLFFWVFVLFVLCQAIALCMVSLCVYDNDTQSTQTESQVDFYQNVLENLIKINISVKVLLSLGTFWAALKKSTLLPKVIYAVKSPRKYSSFIIRVLIDVFFHSSSVSCVCGSCWQNKKFQQTEQKKIYLHA